MHNNMFGFAINKYLALLEKWKGHDLLLPQLERNGRLWRVPHIAIVIPIVIRQALHKLRLVATIRSYT